MQFHEWCVNSQNDCIPSSHNAWSSPSGNTTLNKGGSVSFQTPYRADATTDNIDTLIPNADSEQLRFETKHNCSQLLPELFVKIVLQHHYAMLDLETLWL